MRDDLIVNAWVGVQDGCEITCSTESKHGVYFTVTSKDAPTFEFAFQAGALRQLIQVGSKALAEMDAPATKRAHDRHGHLPTGCCCQAAEPLT